MSSKPAGITPDNLANICICPENCEGTVYSQEISYANAYYDEGMNST